MVMSWEKILKVEVPITTRQRKLQFTLEDDHVEATKNWHLWWFQVYGFNVKIDQVEDAIYKLNVKYEYVTMYVENASNNRGVWFLHHMHTLRRRLVLYQVRETQLKTWRQNCSISLQRKQQPQVGDIPLAKKNQQQASAASIFTRDKNNKMLNMRYPVGNTKAPCRVENLMLKMRNPVEDAHKHLNILCLREWRKWKSSCLKKNWEKQFKGWEESVSLAAAPEDCWTGRGVTPCQRSTLGSPHS